jgi:WD40 repeat protein
VSNILLWDVQTGRVLRRIEGQLAAVQDLSFSGDGRWLAAGASGSPRILDSGTHEDSLVFDVRTGQKYAVLRGARGAILFATTKNVLSRTEDRNLKIWDVRRRHVACWLASKRYGHRPCR